MQTFEKHLWTTEEIRTLKTLRFELELTYDEISKALNRTKMSCYEAVRRILANEREDHRREVAQREGLVIELAEKGVRRIDIAERLGMTKQRVYYILKKTSLRAK